MRAYKIAAGLHEKASIVEKLRLYIYHFNFSRWQRLYTKVAEWLHLTLKGSSITDETVSMIGVKGYVQPNDAKNEFLILSEKWEEYKKRSKQRNSRRTYTRFRSLPKIFCLGVHYGTRGREKRQDH